MGIFGGRDDQDAGAPSVDAVGAPVAVPVAVNTDGIIPSGSGHSVMPQVADVSPPSAGPINSGDPAITNDGYIMTDPPADMAEPAYPTDQPAADPVPLATPDVPLPTTSQAPSDDLGLIKKQALQQLSPLVGHLNQSPEERFNTTMMLLQSTDDHSLVKVAYEAAQAITDEKTRAQALLDIVNEINYFTSQKTGPTTS